MVKQVSRLLVAALVPALSGAEGLEVAAHVTVRGIYGGVPQEVLDSGRGLREFGLDAVWMGSGSFTPERVDSFGPRGSASSPSSTPCTSRST